MKKNKNIIKYKNKAQRRRKKKQKQLHIPKLLKFKRYFQHTLKGISNNVTSTKISNGIIGLRSCESGYITLKHYDMLKKFLCPITKNKDRTIKITNIWIKFFTDRAMTAKALQSRMGRGKGLPVLWYGRIYNGQLLVEIRSNINLIKSYNVLQIVSKKLPLLTQIIFYKEINAIRRYTLLPEDEIFSITKSAEDEEESEVSKQMAIKLKRATKICYIA